MACISSAARSNITGRAASCRPAPEEPNALVEIERDAARKTPNVRATVQELYDGLAAQSQNRWPSLAFDVGAVNDIASPLFSAGFYYKTFMWPKAAWKSLYEPKIRAAAGLGVAPDQPDPDHYSSRYRALRRAGAGRRCGRPRRGACRGRDRRARHPCDEQAEFGGACVSRPARGSTARTAAPGRRRRSPSSRAMDNVRVLSRTTAFGYYAQNFVGLVERVTDHLPNPGHDLPRERLWQVRAKRVVLATGAIERHMVFADNDRPGIMLAAAARTYLNHYGVAVGKNVGVYTANDSAYAAAIDLKKAGVDVAAIVDLRDHPTGPVIDEARALGIEVNFGRAVIRAGGKLRVVVDDRAAEEWRRRAHHPGRCDPDVGRLDAVGASVLAVARQGRLRRRDQALRARHLCAGLRLGRRLQRHRRAVGDDRRGLCGGRQGGEGCRRQDRQGRASRRSTPSESWSRGMLGAAPGAGPDTTVKAFVDFQNDVTAKDIRQAVHEGMRSIEHVKRFTTNGMATDQGKTSNMHGLAIAAETLGKPIPEVGLTTFRAPYTPVTFGAIVSHARGPLFDPTRKTPIHPWAEAQGAVFEDVGQWKRAWYFPQGRRGHARGRRPRMRRGAQDGRPVRRLDARQDRGGRAGRGQVHGTALHQSVGEAGARPLPLWHHAARGRLHL